MAVELRGFNDLQDDLINMAAALEQGPGVTRALQAGAAPIEQQMLQNASSDPKIISGDLHGSIHTGSVKKRQGGGKRITIGVHHKEKGRILRKPCGVRAWRTGASACASLCAACL